jgi:ABC-type polysaccharide/polyol phosphate transport system ATPase subunit
MSYIEMDNVSIEIPIIDASKSFRSVLKNRLGGNIRVQSNKTSIRALDNISLSLKDGDRLALIGHNGAGKSTLLKTLAGIYLPHQGEVRCSGKIIPLFNMSFGFEFDATGNENINNIGILYGISKNEINSKRDEIIEFSDLGDFINLPVRTYSSGMLMRLSFSIVTTLLQPDILLLDEAVGAGDKKFKDKVEGRLKNFYGRTSIIVMASHSNKLVQTLCNKAILLEHAKIIASGPVDDVLKIYEEKNRSKNKQEVAETV